MTNFKMYEIILDLLGKDKKGSITIEEFESLLNFRSLWMFKQLLPLDGATKRHDEALSPFKVEGQAITASSSLINPTSSMAHFISGVVDSGSAVFKPIDIVTSGELRAREGNTITLPTVTDPVGVLYSDSAVYKIKVYPVALASADSKIDYYKYPVNSYLDYYIDANLTYQYLTASQAEYTLLTSEVARNGSTTTVTSATVEIEWMDAEKEILIEYILSDLGVAIADQGAYQQAMTERQTSLIK